MKKIIFCFALLIFLCSSAFANDESEKMLEDFSNEYEKMFEDALEEGEQEDFLDFDPEKIIKNAASGRELFSIKELFEKTAKKFFYEAVLAAKSMLAIFAVSILAAFLFSEKGGENSASDGVRLCVYMICAGISISLFSKISETAVEAVHNLSLFLKSVFPVLLASLCSSGCISSAAVIQPVVAAAIQLSVHLAEKFFIPLITVSFAVCSVNMLSKEINADKFILFLQKCVKTCLAAMLIIFIGLVGIESMATGAVDGISVKLTKFAASNLVPIVGGILSESVETVMGCSMIIKNSAGICGILAIAYICLSPLIKLGASIAVLKLSAAVLEPVGDSRITKCIWDMSGAASYLFATVASVAVMFILITAIIINTGNRVLITGG